MATETEQLKRNAEDQISRLITQLSDLEELREVRAIPACTRVPRPAYTRLGPVWVGCGFPEDQWVQVALSESRALGVAPHGGGGGCGKARWVSVGAR